MASRMGRDEMDEEKEWAERQREFLVRKKAVFEKTKEADEELRTIRQEEIAEQERFQQKRETKQMRETIECLKNENAKLKEFLQEKSPSLNSTTVNASDSDRKVQSLLAEVSSLKERIAMYEQQHRGVDEIKLELETLRHRDVEQNTATRKLKDDLQRITSCFETQQREKEMALKEVAGLKDEISALEQISEETKQRQLSELQSMKLELETLKGRNVQQNTAVRKLKDDLQRITSYSETQQREKEKALREVASFRDEISALKQISEETQKRQLSELQSTSTASNQQQQQQEQRTGMCLRVLICVKFR